MEGLVPVGVGLLNLMDAGQELPALSLPPPTPTPKAGMIFQAGERQGRAELDGERVGDDRTQEGSGMAADAAAQSTPPLGLQRLTWVSFVLCPLIAGVDSSRPVGATTAQHRIRELIFPYPDETSDNSPGPTG